MRSGRDSDRNRNLDRGRDSERDEDGHLERHRDNMGGGILG